MHLFKIFLLRALLPTVFILNHLAAQDSATGNCGSPIDECQCDTNEPMHHEHALLLDLVKDEYTTHTAINSGAWSETATWENGIIPTDNAYVVIADNVSVSIESILNTVHKTIRIDGKLEFATDTNTQLLVDTLIVNYGGSLIVGTEEQPVQGNVVARIIIADTGDIDLEWDPTELSRGLISHGETIMHGEVRTGSMMLAEPINSTNTLILAGQPQNWRVGDVLVIPGNAIGIDAKVKIKDSRSYGSNQWKVDFDLLDSDENAILGNLDVDDYTLMANKLPFVIHLTRNVIVESENLTHKDEYGINRRSGHAMFMHDAVCMTDTRYVGIHGMGRTDKAFDLDNPVLDEFGNRISGTGINPIGRYPWHFHIGGPSSELPGIVKGVAVTDSASFGVVNHTSHAHITDSVAYNIKGSAFYSEMGDEIGTFSNLAAIRMVGGGRRGTKRGRAGHGVWINGGGILVDNIKVAGAGNAGFMFYGRSGLDGEVGVVDFDVSLLRESLQGILRDDIQTVMSHTVPFELENGLVFGSGYAVGTKYHQDSGSWSDVHSVVKNIIGVNNTYGISHLYTLYVQYEDCEFIGMDLESSDFSKFIDSSGRSRMNYINVTVKGWNRGVILTGNGSTISGGTFQNVQDIILRTVNIFDNDSRIYGDINFLEISSEFDRKNIYMIKNDNISHILDYEVISPDETSGEDTNVIYTLIDQRNGRLYHHNLYLNGSMDQDRDGLFDSWELEQFGNFEQHGEDSFDGSGLLNIEKFLRPDLITEDYDYGDHDNDGIEDEWERAYFTDNKNIGFTNMTDGSGDFDNDGVIDFFEYLYGSNPSDPTSAGFKFEATTTGSEIALSWEAQATFDLGSHYEICVSTNLIDWEPLSESDYDLSENLANGMVQLQVKPTKDYGTKVFFRLEKI